MPHLKATATHHSQYSPRQALLATAFGIALLLHSIPAAAQTPNIAPNPEFSARLSLAADRLLTSTEPTFTPEFILADVTSTQTIGRRRFDNFHGDISGRYLSAMAFLPKEKHPPFLTRLISDIIANQQPDGRFGRPALVFSPDQLGPEHMALLWGNGRLLVGLLDIHQAYPSPQTLGSARRLGDFLLQTISACSTPDAVNRLKDLKANGYICFTQLCEGLAMLAKSTGDGKYADAAATIYPWLPPRGTQHSHGYLCTLRGVMLLHELRHRPEDLAFVEKNYRDLVTSPDYMPFGGVNEYFGSLEEHNNDLRSEGCSEADFFGLSMQLYHATGNIDYLQKAEHSLLNELSFNQFASGDFGHHHLDGRSGYRLGDQDHKAWWCCTMHGLRFLALATRDGLAHDRLTTQTAGLRVITPAGKVIPVDAITTTTAGYLFHGPYLLAADGYVSPNFLAEPASNTIYANTSRPAPPDPALPDYRQKYHVLFDYTHGGFQGTWTVRLRPVGDITFHPHRTWVRALLTFAPAPATP
jgi:hypothetical protein